MDKKEKQDMEEISFDTLSQDEAQLLYDKSNVYLVIHDGHVTEAWLDYDEGE